MKKIINKLRKHCKSKFYFDYDTSQNVWFRAGGKAAVFCLVYNVSELQEIIKNIGDTPYKIIGAGSNFLIRDSGFEGIIFKLGKDFNKIQLYENYIEVGAGILDVNLSKFAKKNNIKDFEFFSGIPGTIGGAVIMNAGCYNSETKQLIKEVTTIDSKGEFNVFSNDQLKFTYRKSNVPNDHVVISVNFNYVYGNEAEIAKKINEIKIMREKSQPLQVKTSGSTFKNPKNNFAAKLIESSGCKNMSVGDVIVSKKHCNFLININKASATQIEELGNRIIDRVYNQFNIKLEWEIKIIGN